MSPFSHLIRFESADDGSILFADLGRDVDGPPPLGSQLDAFPFIDDMASGTGKRKAIIGRVSGGCILFGGRC